MSDKLEHDFDGIEELDNPLPGWWLGIFWVTILLAAFYVPYYHFINPDKLPRASYEAEMAASAAEKEAAKEAEPAEAIDLNALYEAGGWEESAKADFNMFCLACHGPDGGGTIGPNFTDDYSIHGGTLENIIRVIEEGVPEKGMISWKVQLKPEQIRNLAFFI